MVFTGVQPLDGNTVPISSEYSPQNNTFLAMQGADGAYVDAYGNASTAPVMSFVQPRIVQRAVAQTGAGAKTLSCSFNAANVGGNSIVVCLGVGDIEDAVTSFMVTDTQGNTYTKCAFSLQGGTLESSIYFATGIKLGTNIITVSITGPAAVPTGISMKVYEVWGLIASVDALDQSAAGNNASGLIASTGAFAPVSPNEMAFTALAVVNVTTITPSKGWTANDGTIFPWGGNLGAFDSQTRQLSTIAPIIPQATLSLPSAWAMTVATFRTIVLPFEGTVNYAPCSNAPMTVVSASLTPIQLLAANGARLGTSVFNASSGILFLAYGAVTNTTLYFTQLPSKLLWEMPQPIFRGPIYGWWNSVNGNANIAELS
jgi:hypothetical protein